MTNESKDILIELNRSDNPAELGLNLVDHSADGEFEIWTGDAGRFRRVVNLNCIAEYRWEMDKSLSKSDFERLGLEN